MKSHPYLKRVSDPRVCFGKPTVRGTRIWVSLILDLLAGGMTMGELLEEYPQLTTEDIRAAIAYGAEIRASATSCSPSRYPHEVQAG